MCTKPINWNSVSSKRVKPEPLIVDIFLNHDSSRQSSAKLTMDFIKFLCYQKGQIPMPYPQLINHLNKVKNEQASSKKLELSGMKMKERTAALKAQRHFLSFIKKAETMNENMNSITESVVCSFDSNIHQITAIVGTSIFNPKEIFTMDWSLWRNHDVEQEGHEKLSLQNQSTFFRFLVTNDLLYPVMQSIKLTKLHVLCKSDCEAAVGCLPRLNYQLPPRGRQIILRILPKSRITASDLSLNNTGAQLNPESDDDDDDERSIHQTVNRRLVFASPSPNGPLSFFKKVDSELDLSGIIRMDDDLNKSVNETPMETQDGGPAKLCWFQVQSSILGFHFS